jgi:hypothetical protein
MQMTYADALRYCETSSTRFPYKWDIEELARYLGQGTSKGYSPFQSDGQKELMPQLNIDLEFLFSYDPEYAEEMAGKYHSATGKTTYFGRGHNYFYDNDAKFAVRCVGEAQKRVTVTGATIFRIYDSNQFRRIHQWRDSRGLIWHKPNYSPKQSNLKDAIDYCKNREARLPTKAEFDLLRRDLGYVT